MLSVGWQETGLVALCAANIALGLLVIAHDPRAATNRLFFVTVLVVVGWISSISLAFSSTNLGRTVLLGRVGFAFATLMPFALLNLFLSFRSQRTRRADWVTTASGVLCGTFVLLSLSSWILAGATTGATRPNFVYGPLHPLLGLYVITCLAMALYALWATTQATSGIKRVQLRYLLAGVLLGGLGIVVTNLLIPLIWKTSHYSVFGPYFTLVFVSFSAHAIIRHRLMDIRFFARKSVVYVSALAVASIISFGAVVVTRSLSGHTVEHIPITAAVVLALVIAICFQPLKGLIQSSLNRYLYRETYDYQRTVRSITRQLATILDLNSLLLFLTNAIHRTFKCERVAIYLPDPLHSEFTAKTAISDSHTPEVDAAPLPSTSPLLTYLESRRRYLLADDPPRDSHVREAVAELKQRGGELVIPFLEHGAVSGVLLIGRKLSGDPYLADDLDLLSILVGQAAIAIKNAYLYREVVIANERIENIVETMESGVVAIAANSVVTLFNSAAERITGRAAGTLKGSHVKQLPSALAEPIAATLVDREPRLQIETLLPDGAGRLVPIIYSTSIVKDRSGVPFGVVAVFSDLTKVRELEAEKRRTERLASIGAFASGIAHEIKNPLVAIKTFAELLPERFTEEDFRNDFSRVAIREIERIDELVGRLRGLVTSQPQQLNPLSIRELADETLALLRGQLEQSQISVSFQDETAGLVIAGDRGQIKQLLLNVFINAIEAMSAGGTLSISLSQIDRRAGGQILILVGDTGPGIPDDMLARLFDPFVTTKPQGSGLGLSICRGIVEAHRGTIRAQNDQSGRGATILIELPINRNHPSRPVSSIDEDTHLFSRPGNSARR